MRRASKVLAILFGLGVVILISMWMWVRADLARIDDDLDIAQRTPVAQRAVDAIVAVEDPGFIRRSRFTTLGKASLTNSFVRWHIRGRSLSVIAREVLLNALIDLRNHDHVAQATLKPPFSGALSGPRFMGSMPQPANTLDVRPTNFRQPS